MNCLPRYSRCISSLTLAEIGIRPHSLPTLFVIALLFSRSIASRRVAHCVPHSALFALTPLRSVACWRALFGGGRLGSVGRRRFYSLRRASFGRSFSHSPTLRFATFSAHVLPFPHRSAPFVHWGYRPKPRWCSLLRSSLWFKAFKLLLHVIWYLSTFFNLKSWKSILNDVSLTLLLRMN